MLANWYILVCRTSSHTKSTSKSETFGRPRLIMISPQLEASIRLSEEIATHKNYRLASCEASPWEAGIHPIKDPRLLRGAPVIASYGGQKW